MRPKLHDFKTLEAYLNALIDWKLEQVDWSRLANRDRRRLRWSTIRPIRIVKSGGQSD